MFNLYNLATHPDIQERLYKEVVNVVPDAGKGTVTAEVIDSMSFLKDCVKENFRLLPNGTEVSRILDEDLVLSGYRVPKGTHVDINLTVNFR